LKTLNKKIHILNEPVDEVPNRQKSMTGSQTSTQRSTYVLVTPAYNEEKLIGQTIASVAAQTLLPKEWIIVSDRSSDRTDEIVTQASEQHPWIRLLRIEDNEETGFARVVRNTETGVSQLSEHGYEFIGLLDADVTFQNDYFERLTSRFLTNPKLGLAGGVVIDVGLPRNVFPRNLKDVPGAVQFFRRTCFESLGGLIPIPEGGWDGMTCVMSRMNGYETKLMTDLVVDHQKPRNISQGGVLRRKYQMGTRDYAAGYHPLFELLKCASRITSEKPFLIASVAWGLGYLGACIKRKTRIVPKEVILFIHGEQMERINPLGRGRISKATN
jgi:poly-beta-1,6-N-acetyl-D-glucosamine synthase